MKNNFICNLRILVFLIILSAPVGQTIFGQNQQIQDYVIDNLPEGNKANDYGSYKGSMSNHDKVYQNLVDVLHHHAPMAAGSYDGLKTVEIIEKIYAASGISD